MTATTATKTYVAQYRYILMTGRQKFFTEKHKCRPFTMLKNTLGRAHARMPRDPFRGQKVEGQGAIRLQVKTA